MPTPRPVLCSVSPLHVRVPTCVVCTLLPRAIADRICGFLAMRVLDDDVFFSWPLDIFFKTSWRHQTCMARMGKWLNHQIPLISTDHRGWLTEQATLSTLRIPFHYPADKFQFLYVYLVPYTKNWLLQPDINYLMNFQDLPKNIFLSSHVLYKVCLVYVLRIDKIFI